MISNMELYDEKITLRRYYSTIKNKYKKEKAIKIQSRKKTTKFIYIMCILLFIIILFTILFFASKKMYKKEHKYPQDDLTLVCAYYKVNKSKHSSNEYLLWISNIVKLNKSMVFFTNKEFMPFFKEHRPKKLYNKTVFIELEYEEFYSYKNFYNEFNEAYKIDPENQTHSVPLYIIWAEKCMFLKKAIKRNYFNSKCFYWVDAGYFRESEKGMKRYKNHWPTIEKCFEDDRLILGQVRKFTEEEKQKIVSFDNVAHETLKLKINVAANFFGGQIKNSLKFVDLYYDTIKLFLKKHLFIGKEQNIYTYMAFAHPEVIKLIPEGWYTDFKSIFYYN